MVIADTLPSYMGRGINDKSNSEVKQVLEPFLEFLEEKRAALIGIVHIGKSQDARTVRNLILDSVAYPNTARTVFFAMHDPRIPGRRLFCSEKNNVGELRPTLAYKVVPTSYINPKDGLRIPTSLIEWEPDTDPLTSRGGLPLAEELTQRRPTTTTTGTTRPSSGSPSSSRMDPSSPTSSSWRPREPASAATEMYDLKDQAGVRAKKAGGPDSPWRWGLGDPYLWPPYQPDVAEPEQNLSLLITSLTPARVRAMTYLEK